MITVFTHKVHARQIELSTTRRTLSVVEDLWFVKIRQVLDLT